MSIVTPEDRQYLVDLDQGLLRLTFNRPDQANAIRTDTTQRLTDLFQTAQANSAVRAVHVRGAGKNFSAGGDVPGFLPTLDMTVADRQQEFRGRIGRLGRLVRALVAFDRPILVEMRGAAAGAGLLFTLAADYVIGDPTALFVFAHQSLGLCPDGGVSALLPQVVGLRTARSLVLTSARVSADDALRIGLLNQIVDAETLESESARLAERLAKAPQTAVVQAKQLINASVIRSLAEQMDAETAGITECVAHDDFAEGVRAFVEKRKPAFPSAR